MINKNIIYIILIPLPILIQGCGVFSKIFKTSSKVKENTEINVIKESKDNYTDNSIIIITEKLDTTIRTLPKKIETNIKINDLSDFIDLYIIKSDLLDVKQNYDKISKTIKTVAIIKTPDKTLKIDKTTIIKNNINASKSLKIDSTYNKKSLIKSSEKTKVPVNLTWYIVSAILIIGVGYFIFKNFSKIKKSFTKLITV